MSIASCAAAATAALVMVSAASAQTFTPLAFGPLGGPVGDTRYFTRTVDISGDGTSFVGQLNDGTFLYRTPTGDFTLGTNANPLAISRDGLTISGGTADPAPQRWLGSAAVGNTIAPQPVTWPGGPLNIGPAYGVNSNGTVFATVNFGVSVVTPTGRVQAQTAFTAQQGSAGAFRGLAADATVVAILGSIPGNSTNAYRWNYVTGALSPLNMPAGAGNVEVGGTGSGLSADASIIGGTATFGVLTVPYWWDGAGSPHAVPLLPGAVNGSMNAMNFPGTLGGGGMSIPLQGSRAYIYPIGGGAAINLHDAYSAAGLLPTGWVLTNTQHISDDGSRIFCLATAPDGTTRSVMLTGNFAVPAPGAAALLGVAGLVAGRRRR